MSRSIGLLCHHSVGGSSRVAVELAVALADRGHAVHLFARAAPLGVPRAAQNLTVHTLGDGSPSGRLDLDWSPAEVAALAGLVVRVTREIGLDVLHFHYAVPFADVAEQAAQRLGRAAPPVVGTLHGTDVSGLGQHPQTCRSLARTLLHAQALTTVSHAHAELASATFGLPERPTVIGNFVDAERFRPRATPVGLRARPRIAHVSNFRAVKNPLAVGRVFEEVRRSIDAELWLIGDGEGMRPLCAQLRRANLMAHTRRLGLRSDVEQALSGADALLLTSHAESFSLAALEAAACGLPVVAPRVGGVCETVLDGVTGTLFAPGDEPAAAAALVDLLSDRERRAAMGDAAVEHARRQSAATVVARYERLYDELMPAGGAAGPPAVMAAVD